ncbi:MltF family protein [Acanthopleuribacter pedis]|uniref:Transglycosylase SLT domain-containing protein n=1 Tax=Acanthopleuribacter pedis TaxID=442870 RepID=A0A8J7U5A0_9BACT|nr:transglycosylase SLT domain-containing protein [Acanthopleuribacter pedis]MBO1322323.1 transglycosylase SLT domain-containing protein [Acanthopleuribacter pedis]
MKAQLVPTLLIGLLLLAACTRDQSGDAIAAAPADPVPALPPRDLETIRAKRELRILITPNHTNFMIAGDRPRGFEYELFRQYERRLNKGYTRRDIHLTAIFIPVEGNELLPRLLAGEGDIAAGMLTITPGRLHLADFTDPILADVRQIVVGHQQAGDFATLEALAGRAFYVKANSGYLPSLRRLNHDLETAGLVPVTIDTLEGLETEDILELINAGGGHLTVVDDYMAELWAQVMPNLKRYPHLVLDEGGEIGWAVRKENPSLLADLNAFIAKNRKGTRMGNVLFKRYYGSKRWITNPFRKVKRADLEKAISLFKKYGAMYETDWRMIAALAYQESKFDNTRVSRAGAVGLMQIKPSTAADPQVGIENIREMENNVHAGVRYLVFIQGRYFKEDAISTADRLYFAMAAYNAGPARVQKLRRRAKAMKLDPNRWFGHVEKAALKDIGQETVRYVANIRKYHLMFREGDTLLTQREHKKRELLRTE